MLIIFVINVQLQTIVLNVTKVMVLAMEHKGTNVRFVLQITVWIVIQIFQNVQNVRA